MEALLELLLMIILEVFGEIAFGVVGDFLLSSVRNALGFEEERRHPGLAAFGFVLLGSAAGALSAFLMPNRLTPLMPVPGRAWSSRRPSPGSPCTCTASGGAGGAMTLRTWPRFGAAL